MGSQVLQAQARALEVERCSCEKHDLQWMRAHIVDAQERVVHQGLYALCIDPNKRDQPLLLDHHKASAAHTLIPLFYELILDACQGFKARSSIQARIRASD